MLASITETLRKINIELKGSPFLSLFLSFLCISLFLLYRIATSPGFSYNSNFSFAESTFINNENKEDSKHFIYASSRGTKYYFYNCKSTIKEANKIFFDSEDAAKRAGYTLAKACQ